MNTELYRLVCHRGLFDNQAGVPENSLKAFSLAVARGHGIELDVHVTRDNRLVVFHDSKTARMTGVDCDIEALTLAEIKALRLCGGDQCIPTMEEVLQTVDGAVPLIIEIKNDIKANIGRLEPILMDMLSRYSGEYVLESFNPRVVRWLKLNAPSHVRGQLICYEYGKKHSALKNKAIDKVMINPYTRPQFIAYDITELTEGIAKKVHSKGLALVAWTVKTQAQLALAQKFCDCIIYEKLRP